MKKFYLLLQFFCCSYLLLPKQVSAQNCNNLSATCTGYESRCASTGSIKINASGGSGSYKYRVVGPVVTNYTSTDSITGLSAGIYIVQVVDFVSNCTFTKTNIIVAGTYQDPRFTLSKVDVSCDNGNNGSISLSGQLFGLSPFTYSIVAPSPMGVGTINTTGYFPDLSAGNYFIRLTDSCGGIQTRQITINNYSWQLVEYPFTKISCYEATGYIKVADSRGNISTVSGIPGFMYGIVTAPGDTTWSSSPYFTVPIFANNSFEVVAKDTCGIIKKGAVNVSLTAQVGAQVLITNKTCSTFTASLTDIRNFFMGQFCLRDSLDVIIECNSTGTFNNIPYGSYCITAYDVCADLTITRCFSATPPPISIADNVQISNKTCTDFTASIIRQIGLTNPLFCLYDSSRTLINCNNTGVFSHLPYGNYCITVKDGCRDTIIQKCFTAVRPTPYIGAISPSYVNCRNFGINVGGDTLSSPQYCLYDSSGVLITCNTTGIFDSLALGHYCVNVYDSCYDTTITRCFTVNMPVLQNNLELRSSHRTCTSFSLEASSNNFTNPTFCLYNSADSLIGCNSTGIFNNLPFGTYCVQAHNDCPDTTFKKCITVVPQPSSVDENVQISNTTCTTFTASITGQYYLTNPQYCLYNSADSLITCNTGGVFNRLPYGRYCIKIRNTCYDTTIVRCFSRAYQPVQINVRARSSCSFNYAKLTITLSSGTLPVNIRILRPNGTVFFTTSYNSNTIEIDSIPGIPVGSFYKIIAEDACGGKDSTTTGAIASFINFNTTVDAKCPGASWANGSGDIAMAVNTNMGSLMVRIIKKDGDLYQTPLVPNTANGGIYTFTDLGPGTYVMQSSESFCNNIVYDTVTIFPYQFPDLSRSSAHQCDQDGFSVSAVATHGVAPFTYQIIGSVPAFPSIVSAPQTNSIFNINNGSTYSLIRLRALDACGNATLGDASILPLTSYGIRASLNCMFYPTTLSVDTIVNAGYTWYKKASATAADSVLVGSAPALYIPYLTPADTGVYVCYMNVYQGCIKRTYVYRLTGSCYVVLPVKLTEFKGRQEEDKHLLTWKTNTEQNLAYYAVERLSENETLFSEIGKIPSRGSTGTQQYQFYDRRPAKGNNYYRLKMGDKDGSFSYSNIVSLQQKKPGIVFSVYPNPVSDVLNIRFINSVTQQYTLRLYNLTNQVVYQQNVNTDISKNVEMRRPVSLMAGVYILHIINTNTKEQVTQKIVFL